MAVDKFKNHAAGISLDDNDFFISVDSKYGEPLQIWKSGDLSLETEAVIEDFCKTIYEEQVPKNLRWILSLSSVYTATNYNEATEELKRLDKYFQIFDSPRNQRGEFAEGRSVYNITERLLQYFARVELPDVDYAKNAALMSYSASYNYAELIGFSTLGGLADIFRHSEKWYLKFVEDLTAVLYHSNLTKRERLAPRPPALPAFLLAKDDSGISTEVQVLLDKSNGILFSELYSQFLTHKKKEVNLSKKMQDDYNDYVKTFLFALGDKPIKTFTKRQIKDFLLIYGKLPRRNMRAYMDKSIEELWGLVVPEIDRIATRTMLSVKKFLLGVFRFAVSQEYLTESPVINLDLKIKLEKRRGHFTDSEVRKFFDVLDTDRHILKNEWQKWAVLFGAYTGARASEIMELLRQDFKLCGDSGIWSVIVRGTKTGNALREFPVPPELISKGFLDFVGGGSGRVFPSDKGNKAITSFFPRVLKVSGIPKINNKNLPRSFHSFRHTVVTKARGAGFDKALVQQIVGHEKTGAGITDTYTHDFTALQLLPVVTSISYQR